MIYTLKTNETGCTERIKVEQMSNGNYLLDNTVQCRIVDHKPTDRDILDFAGSICLDDWYIEAKPIFRKDGSRVYTHVREIIRGIDCLKDEAGKVYPLLSEEWDTIDVKAPIYVRNTNRKTNDPYWLRNEGEYEVMTFYKCLVEDKRPNNLFFRR